MVNEKRGRGKSKLLFLFQKGTPALFSVVTIPAVKNIETENRRGGGLLCAEG
jgi:hypothetical protein